MTKEQIEQLAAALGLLANTFSPDNAKAVVQLIGIATQLNNAIDAIKNQTPENEAAVWHEVSENYSDAVSAFEASMKPSA